MAVWSASGSRDRCVIPMTVKRHPLAMLGSGSAPGKAFVGAESTEQEDVLASEQVDPSGRRHRRSHRAPKREARLDDFLELGGGRDQLNLILISEHSLHLWEMLRVAQVRRREQQHVESAIDDARRSLAQERRRTEELVASVMSCVNELRQVRPLEFHRILSAREMRQTAADIQKFLRTSRGRHASRFPS
jgi:hypothetical protein